MNNVGFATLALVPAAASLGSALHGETSRAVGSLDAPGRRGGVDLGRSTHSLFERVLGPLAIAAAVTTIATGVARFVSGSMRAAGGLEQSIGAIDTVFKGSAGQMHDWAKGAAMDVGLTRNEFNELGTLIGTQLKNGGTAMEELGPKTNSLIELGADLSSMFGGTTKEAVEALSSALKGERDPIERFGVSLNQAAIDAKAAELGFAKVGGSLSAEANQAATLALIMEQTADAHGNFAKEAVTYEGINQRLSASWGNISTSIGTGFLPFAAAASSVLLSMMPAVQGLADGFSTWGASMSTIFTDAGGGMAGLQAMLSNVGATIAEFISGGGLMAAFSGLAEMRSTLFNSIIQALPGILGAYVRYVEWIGPVILSIAEGISTVLTAELAGLAMLVSSGLITQLVTALLGMLPSLITTLLGMVPTLLTTALTLFQGLITAVVTVLPMLITSLVSMLPGIVTTLLTMLPTLIESALSLFLGLVEGLVTAIPQLLTSLLEALPQILSTLLGMLPGLIEGAISLFFGLILGLLDVLPKLLTTLLTDVLPSLITTVAAMIPDLLKAAIDLFKSLITGLKDNVPKVVAAIVEMIPLLVGAITGITSTLFDVGVNMIEGLLIGLGELAGAIADFLLAPIADMVDGVKDLLGIHSPSRVAYALGEALGESVVVPLPAQMEAPQFGEDYRGLRLSLSSGASTVPGQQIVNGGEHWDPDTRRRVLRALRDVHRDAHALP